VTEMSPLLGKRTYRGGDDYLAYEDTWKEHTCFSNINCLNCEIGGFCGGGCAIEKQTKGFDSICLYEKENFQSFIREIAIPHIKEMLHEAKIS